MHADVDLKLVPDEDREIVPCPDWAREDVRRAVQGCLEDIERDVTRCWRRASEGRLRLTAMGLLAVRVSVRKLVEMVRGEP